MGIEGEQAEGQERRGEEKGEVISKENELRTCLRRGNVQHKSNIMIDMCGNAEIIMDFLNIEIRMLKCLFIYHIYIATCHMTLGGVQHPITG